MQQNYGRNVYSIKKCLQIRYTKRHIIHICIIGIRHGKEVSVILEYGVIRVLIESIKEGVIHMSKVLVTFSASE